MKRLVTAVFSLFFMIISLSVTRADEEAHYIDVDTAELSALRDKGVKVIDIRRADEWGDTGVIPGSKLITAFDARGRFSPGFASDFASIVNNDEEVIIICRTGNRSQAVSRVLAAHAGYTRIYNASGGILSWIGAGNETEPCPVC